MEEPLHYSGWLFFSVKSPFPSPEVPPAGGGWVVLGLLQKRALQKRPCWPPRCPKKKEKKKFPSFAPVFAPGAGLHLGTWVLHPLLKCLMVLAELSHVVEARPTDVISVCLLLSLFDCEL